MRLRWILGILLLFIVGLASAQEAQCEAFLNEWVLASAEQCSDMEVNTVCNGAEAIVNDALLDAGEVLSISEVQTLATSGLDLENNRWGMAHLKVDMGSQPVDMVLYGDAQLTNLVEGAVAVVELPIRNAAGYTVNLRGGPGTQHAVVGTLDSDVETVTNGRSADNQWFRITTLDGVAWIHTSLVSVNGDIEQLPIASSIYTAPLQSMLLQTTDVTDNPCAISDAGLLLDTSGDESQQIEINGVEIAFNDATVLVQSNAEMGLITYAVRGEMTVTANSRSVDITTGGSASVALDAEGIAAAAPEAHNRYRFSAIAGAPLGLIQADDAVCVAGITIQDESPVIYSGPGDEYAVISEMQSDSHYAIVGYAPDGDAQNWWKLDGGINQSWVPQDQVRTAGLCANIAEAEPPTQIAASVNSSAATGSFLPAEQSVWQAYSGQDVMTGNCANTPPMAVCNHLVALIPNGDGTLTWRGQEPTPYLMTANDDNSFFHQGRNYQNTANITMQMTMTSETTWEMTWTTVFDDNPECTHTFYYTATRQW